MAGKVEGKQAKSEQERLRPKNAAIWSPLLLGLSGVSRRVVSVIYRHLVSSRHFLVKDIFGGILVAYRLGSDLLGCTPIIWECCFAFGPKHLGIDQERSQRFREG